MKGASKEVDDFNLDRTSPNTPRQHRANIASSRMTGRPAVLPLSRSSKASVDTTPLDANIEGVISTRPNSFQDTEGLASKITAWIQREKHRRASRKARRKNKKKQTTHNDLDFERSDSDASSEGSIALDHLQDILNRSLAISDRPSSKKGLTLGARKPSRAKLRRPSAASESEFTETEDLVPTCDVILDNSKTLSYSGGKAETEIPSDVRPPLNRESSSSYNRDAWKSFKYEIVRLTHTLRLKGWRRVPMQMSSQIEVIRLSGALTNAVYEVLPPKELPAKTTDTVDGTVSSHPKSMPQWVKILIAE
jgi:choline kinase